MHMDQAASSGGEGLCAQRVFKEWVPNGKL